VPNRFCVPLIAHAGELHRQTNGYVSHTDEPHCRVIIILIIVPLMWLRQTLNLKQTYNTCIRVQIQRTAYLAGQQ